MGPGRHNQDGAGEDIIESIAYPFFLLLLRCITLPSHLWHTDGSYITGTIVLSTAKQARPTA